MNAHALSLEMDKHRLRTRKTIVISLMMHSMLFLLLLLHETVMPEPMVLTEINWIEPEPVVPAAVAPPAKVQRHVPATQPSLQQKDEHFVRKTEKSDFAPQPQSDRTFKDRMDRKLASLDKATSRDLPKIASLAASNIVHGSALAAIPDGNESGNAAIALERSNNPVAGPIQLARGDKRPSAARVKLSAIPEKTVKLTAMAKAESTARRMIDGMSLVGPVADRMLLKYGKPGYPDWAKREGIEGSVDLYFIVLPSGRVKENVLVQKTSGFEDFDNNAIDALVSWKFEPLEDGRTDEQWGAITFDYRLTD